MHVWKNKTIGISITTHNRSNMLRYCLQHFNYYNAFSQQIIVVSDDASNEIEAKKNEEICKLYGVEYIYNPTRLGIAKNKNKTIDYLNQFSYDYIFLFDDDCFPKASNWDLPFIELYKDFGIQHSMYLIPVGELHVLTKRENYEIFDNCSGFCLFFTREAMNQLKGMNPDFGIYGFEHAELTNRAYKANLNNNVGKNISPISAKEVLFSYDMDKGWLGKESPLGPFQFNFTSSIEDERESINGYIDYNRKVFLNT